MGEPARQKGLIFTVHRHMGSVQQSGSCKRAGHKSQGTSPGQGHPVNLSQVLAPDVNHKSGGSGFGVNLGALCPPQECLRPNT
jgi:hypothetical protein